MLVHLNILIQSNELIIRKKYSMLLTFDTSVNRSLGAVYCHRLLYTLFGVGLLTNVKEGIAPAR